MEVSVAKHLPGLRLSYAAMANAMWLSFAVTIVALITVGQRPGKGTPFPPSSILGDGQRGAYRDRGRRAGLWHLQTA